MDDFWFEEDLIPMESTVEEIIKSNKPDANRENIKRIAHSTLRVDKPRWTKLDADTHKILSSGTLNRFFLVRLGFQFDISEKLRKQGVRFTYARCAAYLWSLSEGSQQPRVYDVIPRDLYEGTQRKVSVKLSPEIKMGDFGGSLGELSTDFNVGVVEPVVVGWTGNDEREPYWDLRPESKMLLGVRHLWLIVEMPVGCSGLRLSARAEGNIQTYLGPISIGPQMRDWASRPSIVIQ